MIEHTSDVSEAPKITCRAQQGRAHRTYKHLPIYASRASHEESSLGASTARPRAAENRLDDLDRSADGPGAGGHGCEQIERRNGYECGQEPRQVAAKWRVGKGRVGVGRGGHGGGRHTLSYSHLADVLPPVARFLLDSLHRDGQEACASAGITSNESR